MRVLANEGQSFGGVAEAIEQALSAPSPFFTQFSARAWEFALLAIPELYEPPSFSTCFPKELSQRQHKDQLLEAQDQLC